MSEELQLKTEDLEIATEGIGDFIIKLFTGDSETIAIDFQIPDIKYDSFKGVVKVDEGSTSKTLKYFINFINSTVTSAIEEIKHSAQSYYRPSQTISIIKNILDTWEDSIKKSTQIAKQKTDIRSFRLPKDLIDNTAQWHKYTRMSSEQIVKISSLKNKDSGALIDIVYNIIYNKTMGQEERLARILGNKFWDCYDMTLDYIKLVIDQALDCVHKKKLSLEEAQVEVQTNEPTEDTSNVIILDVPGYLEKVKTSLPILVDSIGWLQEYKQDPYKAVGKFTEEGHVLCEQFKDIKDGLVGAFSSEKATLLGAKKLLTFIESTADSVKNDYTELSNRLANWVAKDLSANLNSIIETTDPGMLEKRKLMYRQNNVTLKYGNFKLEKCIQPYIQEISSSMDMVEYLKRIKELQHSLKLDLKPLEETIRKYKYNNTYIANNNVYIGKSQFMDNKVEKDPELPKTANHLEAYKTFLAQVDVSQDTDTVAADILDNIIDNFNGTLQGLKRSVEDFLKLLNSIGENNSKFNDSIDVLISQYVLPYGENTCLKDDFIVGYNQCMLAISNSLNNDENLISHISYVGSQLECLLNNYSYLYSFLEKLTVEMTITEKSSVSE